MHEKSTLQGEIPDGQYQYPNLFFLVFPPFLDRRNSVVARLNPVGQDIFLSPRRSMAEKTELVRANKVRCL